MQKAIGIIIYCVLAFALVKAFGLGGAVIVTGILAFLVYSAKRRESKGSDQKIVDAELIDDKRIWEADR